MEINVKRIPIDGETLQGTDPTSILDIADGEVDFNGEIAYEVQVQVQGGALLVRGRLETPVTLRCARCLAAFEQTLAVGAFIVHHELTGEEVVDLTPQMREDIILALPQRALCRSECKGLCPRCGEDLNQADCRCASGRGDWRWQGLDQLNLK